MPIVERLDMPEALTPTRSTRRISWGAIFAGVVVALVVQLTLGVLGIAIGAGSMNPLSQQDPLEGFGKGAGIWFAVSTLIALFAGGWVAGRMAGVPRNLDSLLHGVLTWGVATLFTLYLLTTAVGVFISGGASILGKSLELTSQSASAGSPNIAQAAKDVLRNQGINIDPIINDVKSVARKASPSTENQLMSKMSGIVTSGKDAFDQNDKAELERILTSQANMDRSEASAMVDRWNRTYQQAKSQLAQTGAKVEQQARQIGATTANVVSQAALWTFIGFVFGALAAALGGYLSRPRDLIAEPTRTI